MIDTVVCKRRVRRCCHYHIGTVRFDVAIVVGTCFSNVGSVSSVTKCNRFVSLLVFVGIR